MRLPFLLNAHYNDVLLYYKVYRGIEPLYTFIIWLYYNYNKQNKLKTFTGFVYLCLSLSNIILYAGFTFIRLLAETDLHKILKVKD